MGNYRLRVRCELDPSQQLEIDGVMWQIRPTQEQSIEVWRPLRKAEYETVTAWARAVGDAPVLLELVDAEGKLIWTSDSARLAYLAYGLDMSTGVPTGLRENYLFSGQVTWRDV